MAPISRFGNAVAEIFEEMKESLGLQKHEPIGRMSATQRSAPVRPTPLLQRLSRQIFREQDGQPLQKKASMNLSFGNHFQLLVFSTRLKFAGNLADLNTLKKEVGSFKKALKDASGSASTSTPRALTSLIESIESELVKKDPKSSIPAAPGPKYEGW